MMEPTRRTFVTGLLAAAPAMTLAQVQPAPAPANDPVWSHIMNDLQRIYAELAADHTRRDSLRALESTIRTHAAYSIALGNPGRLQREINRQMRGGGRDFLETARRMSAREHRDAEMRRILPNYESRPSRRPDPSIEELERAAREVARSGHIPVLLAAADMARLLSEQKAQFVRVNAATQWDLCAQMEAQIAALAFLTGFVCAMTFVNPALAPECAALGATLAVMEISYWMFCQWL